MVLRELAETVGISSWTAAPLPGAVGSCRGGGAVDAWRLDGGGVLVPADGVPAEEGVVGSGFLDARAPGDGVSAAAGRAICPSGRRLASVACCTGAVFCCVAAA